jgi:outer membrane lipase/esterase
MFRTRQLSFISVFFLALTFASGAVQALPYSNLVIFGDSLADTGNNAAVFDTEIAPPGTPPGTLRTPTPIPSNDFIATFPYAEKRYSNGPVWVEQFADSLGLSAQASLLGGTNFAFGGARTGPSGGSFPFSLTDQVSMFLGGTGGAAPGDALYVVAGGGNNARDAVELAADGGDPTAIIAAFVNDIATILTQLSSAGAKNILLVNMPNIGLTPAIQAFGPAAAAGASAISAAMNDALNGALASLLPLLPTDVKVFDFFTVFTQTVANPGAFGLTDVTSSCAFSTACIADPDTTLFWDGIHPTTVGHGLIAAAALALVGPVAIPEPSSLALMLIVGFGFVVRRAARRT